MLAAVPDREPEQVAVGEGLGSHGDRDEAGGGAARADHVIGDGDQPVMAAVQYALQQC